jgi:hypothetical protein
MMKRKNFQKLQIMNDSSLLVNYKHDVVVGFLLFSSFLIVHHLGDESLGISVCS